jgi:hypothetical protein
MTAASCTLSAVSTAPRVEYRWDAETAILTASVRATAVGEGPSGLVELVGRDGSWINIEIGVGRIQSVEIAVWPVVREQRSLVPPDNIEEGHVSLPPFRRSNGMASMEIEAPLVAVTDTRRRTFHVMIGGRRPARTLRIGTDLLADFDARSQIAGLWLFNVPPQPTDS